MCCGGGGGRVGAGPWGSMGTARHHFLNRLEGVSADGGADFLHSLFQGGEIAPEILEFHKNRLKRLGHLALKGDDLRDSLQHQEGTGDRMKFLIGFLPSSP